MKFLAITAVSLSLAASSFAAIITTGSPNVPGHDGMTGRLLVGHNTTNSVEINGGSTVASDGNDFGTAAYVGVDGMGNGTLVVTGTGSQFTTTATNSLRVGANAGTAVGSVTVDDGGLIAVGKDLHLGSRTSGGLHTGTASILGGSTFTVTTNAYLGRGGAGNVGEIDITGAGNTLTIGGQMFMNNGGGTGSLLVESGNTVSINQLILQGSDVGSGLVAPTGAGTLDLQITDWSTWNPIAVTTTLDLNADGGSHLLVSSIVDPAGGMFNLGDTIDLITYTSRTGGNFDTIGDAFSTGNGYSFLIGQDSTSVFLEVTAIPEPSSACVLGLVGLGLILRRQRK